MIGTLELPPDPPVCTSEARKIGDTLAPRDRGRAPERTSHLRYEIDRRHGLQRSATVTDTRCLETHDDGVCPGKRVVSWINVCSFYRVIRRTRCQWRTCVARMESHVQRLTAGSTVTTRLDQKGSWIAVAGRIPARMQPLSRWRTLFSCSVPSIRLGAHANSRQGWKCCSQNWCGLRLAHSETF